MQWLLNVAAPLLFAVGVVACRPTPRPLSTPRPNRPAVSQPQPVKYPNLGGVTVLEVASPPSIDGQLEDWDLNFAVPIDRQPMRGRVNVEASDLSVRAAFAFDTTNLYVAVEARDDRSETGQRAWRYGDGFMLTVGSAGEGSATRRFTTFGFPYAPKGEDRISLVNRNGSYFPKVDISDIRFASVEVEKQIRYEAAIPWRHLVPFLPLTHRAWGINLTYVDRDEGSGRFRVQLVADADPDSEQTDWRRVQIARLQPLTQGSIRCQAGFPRKAALAGDTLDLALGCLLPPSEASYRVVVTLTAGERVVAKTEIPKTRLSGGWRIFRPALALPGSASGDHEVQMLLEVEASEGPKDAFVAAASLYVGGLELRDLTLQLRRAVSKAGPKHPLLATAEIRLHWIREVFRNACPAANSKQLKRWVAQARMLLHRISNDQRGWDPLDRVFRFAHRSAVDGTLQPYSVYVPKAYDPTSPPPLLVTLHGSGVDERGTIRRAARDYQSTGWLVVAPQARGLSDFYLGSSGQDVLEVMDHLSSFLPYDKKRVYLEGFSMGGYGAWRLGLLYPERFARVAVLSGCVRARRGDGNPISTLLDRLRNRPRTGPEFLVIHGALDRSVNIQPVRLLIEHLKRLHFPHQYLELPKAAHGGYDAAARVIPWFSL